MQWTKKRIVIAGVAGLFVIGLIGSAAEEQPGGGQRATSAGDAPAAKSVASSTPVPTPTLDVEAPDDRTVYRDRVILTGTVSVDAGGNTQGVRIEVDGRPARVNGGRWSKVVTVRRGENDFRIAASKGSYHADYDDATITRKSTKAEIAAARQARAAARARRMQNYMASAATLPYNQLEKNPDRHAGKRVKFTGQIFQIQEDFGSTVILLSVTDEGYGFWTDNVWVDYDGTIDSAEDDVITVYGTIEGTNSYDTQIGGETYVPQMTARYVVE